MMLPTKDSWFENLCSKQRNETSVLWGACRRFERAQSPDLALALLSFCIEHDVEPASGSGSDVAKGRCRRSTVLLGCQQDRQCVRHIGTRSHERSDGHTVLARADSLAIARANRVTSVNDEAHADPPQLGGLGMKRDDALHERLSLVFHRAADGNVIVRTTEYQRQAKAPRDTPTKYDAIIHTVAAS